MRLLTVGDSFTYGEELTNLAAAWPNLVATVMGYELTNLAEPGIGNTRMIRHCVEQIDNYDIAIIAWSHYARTEFADEWGIFDIWPGSRGLSFTDKISYRKELIDYTTKYHNDEYLYTQHLINIILLQTFLKANNKKYIMLDAFGNTTARSLNLTMHNKVDSTNYIGWPNESMMEWTYRCPTGPRGHFLEQGHQRVADKIYEHIGNLGWVS
jgi:hypothetical protein